MATDKLRTAKNLETGEHSEASMVRMPSAGRPWHATAPNRVATSADSHMATLTLDNTHFTLTSWASTSRRPPDVLFMGTGVVAIRVASRRVARLTD